MTKRTLTIRLPQDWKAGLRAAGRKAKSRTYQGEELAFETPAAFFGRLTARRWELVRTMQGKGAMTMRGIAGLVGRDLKRVHEDVTDLIELGLLERTDEGVECPFARIHIDIEMASAAVGRAVGIASSGLPRAGVADRPDSCRMGVTPKRERPRTRRE